MKLLPTEGLGARGLMKASIRTVPMASKKLFMVAPLGRDDASDVRREPPKPALPEGRIPDEPVVSMLAPAVLFVDWW